jgi:hypothetical protein
MVRLPDDLRRELESALGHPVPEALSQEEIKALGKEVSAKAPGLFRAVADLVGNEVRQAAKHKPEARAARPSGLTRFFYVQDKDGNWVPSRGRYIALIILVVSAFFGFTYVMISPLSGPKSAVRAPSTTVSAPAPPPSIQAVPEGEREPEPAVESEGEAFAGAQVQGQSPSLGGGAVPPPPSPLPGPNPNLPPPPDYAPTQEGQAQIDGLTVVYSRNPGGSGAGEGQGGAVQGAAFYARPKAEGEAGLALTPTRSPSQAQGQEGEGEGKVVGSFWARQKDEGGGLFATPASASAQGEDKGRLGGLEVQALRRGGSEGGEGTGLQVQTPGTGSPPAGTPQGESGGARGKGLEVDAPAKPGEIQVVWRRSQGEVRGGIVPPGGQGAFTPGVGPGPKAPSGGGGEDSALPPPPPGGSP